MNIGETIKNIRKDQGLTQKELAEKTGLALITIQQYERNVREPKLESIKKIAEALGVTMGDLIGDDFDKYKRSMGDELKSCLRTAIKELPQMTHTALEKSYYTAEAEFNNDYRSILLLGHFSQLNSDGKDEAVKRVSELTEVPRYQKNQSDAADPDNSDTPK